jgi:hypothetical protein
MVLRSALENDTVLRKYSLERTRSEGPVFVDGPENSGKVRQKNSPKKSSAAVD